MLQEGTSLPVLPGHRSEDRGRGSQGGFDSLSIGQRLNTPVGPGETPTTSILQSCNIWTLDSLRLQVVTQTQNSNPTYT